VIVRSFFILCLCSSPLLVYGQNELESETVEEKQATVLTQPLVVALQYGKEGGIREFRLNSGDSIFVPSGKSASPLPQTKEPDAYQQQLGASADQIAQKIAAIQKKQKDIDDELFPAERYPLIIEKNALEQDLHQLEEKRDQLQSEKTAKDSLKSAQSVPLPPEVETGFSLKATLTGTTITFLLKTQGPVATETSVKASIDQWVQIFSAEQGQGVDIWAKASPSS
jgi:hypothetical protein